MTLRGHRHGGPKPPSRRATVSGLKYNFSLSCVACPGFFAENILSSIEGSRRDGSKIFVWRGHNNRVDVFALDQFLPITAGSAACFSCHRACMFWDCVHNFNKFTLRMCLRTEATDSTHTTSAHHANPQCWQL